AIARRADGHRASVCARRGRSRRRHRGRHARREVARVDALRRDAAGPVGVPVGGADPRRRLARRQLRAGSACEPRRSDGRAARRVDVPFPDQPSARTFLAMADFMNMLRQAQQVQGRLQELQQELENKTVSASSGGGMVTVTADGKGQVRAVKIDPTVVNPNDIEMLEDLVLSAVTEAQKKAAELAQEEMKRLTGGLSLPFKLPF